MGGYVPSAGGGGGGSASIVENQKLFSVGAGSLLSVTAAAGDFTGGSRFSVMIEDCEVTGAWFYTEKAGAHTIRVKLWEHGNASALASVDVACSGPGLYQAEFATSYAVQSADVRETNFYISMYDTAGGVLNQYSFSDYTNQSYMWRTHVVWTFANYYVAGDANPSATTSPNQTFPIDPIVVEST